ncbi:MAG: elongation factor G [Phototrophicales bacterium]|nr:MAG: elongation factor G [Phototrophicales bacterium]
MKAYPSEQIRNVAIAGHQGSGKTTLVETMLYLTGVTKRMGSVTDGTTVSDFDEEERERQISISNAVVPIEFSDCKINLIDTPGFTDFQGEIQQAIRVSDAVLVVVDAVSGPEVGTEIAFQFAKNFNQPVLVCINRVDRENADFNRTLQQLRERFDDHKFIPITLPIGEQEQFRGVLGAVTQKAYYGRGETPDEPPAEMVELLEEAHLAVVEAAAEADDDYIEKYFSTGTLSIDEIRDGMRKAARNADLLTVPVFVTSGEIGVRTLLEALTVYVQAASGRRVGVKESLDSEEIEFLNPPQRDDGPLAAYVFKSYTDKFGTITYFRIFSGSLKSNATVWNPNTQTEERLTQLLLVRGKEQVPVDELHAGDIGAVAKLKNTRTGDTLTTKDFNRIILPPTFSQPVYAVALHPKTQSDSTKMGSVLTMLTDADQTLHWYNDPATKETILAGMGSMHIDVAIKRAERLGCGLEISVPKVPYRETITKTASATYRHKKQSGGAGQFGEVSLRIEPISPDEPFQFESEIFGGAISAPFVQSTEKGVRSVLEEGVLAGYPVVGVKAVVYDGKEHPVDSKDIAFQIAGRGAFREAFMKAGPALLEPIMTVEVIIPEANMGDIISDLTSRRGRILGMDTIGGRSVVKAQVPLSEIQRYSNDLRSMTGGRGVFTMEFSGYERLPSHLAEPIIAAHKTENEG